MKRRKFIISSVALSLPLAGCAATDGTDEPPDGEETPTAGTDEPADEAGTPTAGTDEPADEYDGPAWYVEKTTENGGGPDPSGSQTVRPVRWVRTDADVDAMTDEELIALGRNVVEGITAKRKINVAAVRIATTDWNTDSSEGLPLWIPARVDYAPNGNWGEGHTVEAGDYDSHEYRLTARALQIDGE